MALLSDKACRVAALQALASCCIDVEVKKAVCAADALVSSVGVLLQEDVPEVLLHALKLVETACEAGRERFQLLIPRIEELCRSSALEGQVGKHARNAIVQLLWRP